MAKNHYKSKKTKKALIAVLLATAVSCTGLAAACGGGSDNDSTDTAPKKEDTQLLKNGDFEFFTTPTEEALKEDKAKYLIKTPTSGTWSSGGDSSNTKSGIIGTTDTAWNALTETGLAAKLDYNADLTSTADDYIDYNGMKSRDILYKDTYAALLAANKIKEDNIVKEQGYEKYFGIVDGKIGDKPVYRNGDGGEYYFELPVEKDGGWYLGDTPVYQNPDDKEFYRDEAYTVCLSVRTQLIENPGTHYEITGEGENRTTTIGGKTYKVYEDEYGNYYYYTDNEESDDVNDKNYISNVLMLHNYPTDSNYNGIHQYYTSQSVTLEANTAAEISVWVKTSNLKFARGYNQLNEEDRGAYIEVAQTIGGNTVDAFKIKAINTEKILADADNADIKNDKNISSNGWIKYTVYVEGCDFGESTVTLNLGLGQSDNYEKLNGYAFFDDVEVKKFVNLQDENCSYTANAAKITANTTCTLTSNEEEKIFVADKAYTNRDLGRYTDKVRNSKDFHYLLNLTSDSSETKDVSFGSNVTAALTTEKSATGKLYASAEQLTDIKTAGSINVTQNNNGSNYTLPKGLKNPVITSGDTIGSFPYNETAFAGSDFSNLLTENLTADGAALPGYNGNVLLMHSRYGAAYTSTITDDSAFKLAGGEHLILSFWVKTSDMKGKTAATLEITDVNDSTNTTSFTLDTTGNTTDVAGKEDIYNGWVQCFFFVANDTTAEKSFKVDFKFGNTTISDTDLTSYYYGWAAVANMQVLPVDEDVYNLTVAGTTSQKFTFAADTDEKAGVEFDSASGTSEIKNGVVNAANYNGFNGGSSSITDGSYKKNYDGKNTNYETNDNGEITRYAGLINKTHFKDYGNNSDIITAFGGGSFTDALKAWEDVFGKTCYQPLIIINNLRSYVELAEANETNYKDYYVEAEEGYSGTDTFEANGKVYRKVDESKDTYSKDTEYYSIDDIVKVANYGFVGAVQTISASSYQAVSVKVKVSGEATAYVYLVDDATHKVLGYSTPSYTYYYDDEGNVLNAEFDGMTEAEHRAAIIYTLRADGLYEDKDGKVFANLGNYKKLYKYSDNENKDFYDENGAIVTYDDLQTLDFGGKYYADANKTAEAAHYLVNSNGRSLYEFKDGAYYYIVSNGEEYSTSDIAVANFDSSYARYVANGNYGEYAVAISANDAAADANGWVTVNFFIHTGSEELKYRLELWSGERGATGVESDGTYKAGAVAFDYSAISVTEEEYTGILNDYELEIREDYNDLLKGKIPEEGFDRTDLAYYEQLTAELIEKGEITDADAVKKMQEKYGYTAKYYAYTLYDSESYVPFNSETAKDGETGYDYSITDEISNEKLAYFTYTNKEMNSVSIFADYAAVQQKIEMNTADEDDDNTDDETTDNAGEAWLLASSIVLLVAILITLVSLLLKDAFKKRKRAKNAKEISKNNYRKRQRYIRKLHLSTETEEPADESAEEPETESDEPKEAPVEEVEEPAETPAEEVTEEPTENEAPEEQPAEDKGETPSEDTEDGEDK